MKKLEINPLVEALEDVFKELGYVRKSGKYAGRIDCNKLGEATDIHPSQLNRIFLKQNEGRRSSGVSLEKLVLFAESLKGAFIVSASRILFLEGGDQEIDSLVGIQKDIERRIKGVENKALAIPKKNKEHTRKHNIR